MYWIILSLVKLVSFPQRGWCKLYDTFYFFSLCIFAQICSEVSGSMELVMVGSQWGVEVGAKYD